MQRCTHPRFQRCEIPCIHAPQRNMICVSPASNAGMGERGRIDENWTFDVIMLRPNRSLRKTMLGPIVRHRSTIIFLSLFVFGAVLIGAANTFQRQWLKVPLDPPIPHSTARHSTPGVAPFFPRLPLTPSPRLTGICVCDVEMYTALVSSVSQGILEKGS